MSQDWRRLADAIKAARKARGWTQDQLADAAGIGFSTVQRIESGRPYSRRPAALPRVERALQWAPDSSDAVLAGGDPGPLAEEERADATSKVVQEAFAQAGLPLPAVVRHELSQGELLDTEVIRFADGRGSLVVIAKLDEPLDEQAAEDLREWSRVQRELRGIVADDKNSR